MIVCIGPDLEKAMKNEVEHIFPQEFPLLKLIAILTRGSPI